MHFNFCMRFCVCYAVLALSVNRLCMCFGAGDSVTDIQQAISACTFVFSMLFLALSVNRFCMHFGAGDSVEPSQ